MSVLVRRRCLGVSAVLAPLFPAPCYVSTGDPTGAQPGSSRRFCTEHDQDTLRQCQSAPLVSSRSPWRPLGWALKGGLLLHLGGLVPGCCTSGASTESVTAGAAGCDRAGAGSRRMLQKSNCPAAGMKCRGHPVHRCGYTSNKLRSWCHHGGGHYPSSCGCRTSGLHTKAVTAGAAPGISCSNPAHELGGGEHGAITLALARVRHGQPGSKAPKKCLSALSKMRHMTASEA